MNPNVAAGLVEPAQRTGRWQLLKADYPADAAMHSRGGASTVDAPCSTEGVCDNCSVEALGSGDLQSMLATISDVGRRAVPELPTAVRVPRWGMTP